MNTNEQTTLLNIDVAPEQKLEAFKLAIEIRKLRARAIPAYSVMLAMADAKAILDFVYGQSECKCNRKKHYGGMTLEDIILDPRFKMHFPEWHLDPLKNTQQTLCQEGQAPHTYGETPVCDS